MNQTNSSRQILYRLAKEEKTANGDTRWVAVLPQPYESHSMTKHYFICRTGNTIHIYDRQTQKRVLEDLDISYATEISNKKIILNHARSNHRRSIVVDGYQLSYTVKGSGKEVRMDVPKELQNYSPSESLLARWVVYRDILSDGSYHDEMPLPEPYVSHNRKGNCIICRRPSVVHIYDAASFYRLFTFQTLIDAYEKNGILFICNNHNNWSSYDAKTLRAQSIPCVD